jgi:N6-L-threonylcarbamoyladenine synthase
LMGSLMVGTAFAKALAYGLKVPVISVDHLQAHILCHFIQNAAGDKKVPAFPFLCLTISGGHTQIVLVKDYFDMEVIGKTIDDAAGEAFDKTAKILGLPYPGGPMVDKYAAQGNPHAFKLAVPKIRGLDYSFSGLKTSFLYLIRDELKSDPAFIEKHIYDLCASMQFSIISALMKKLVKASEDTGIKQIAIAGGVSANSLVRSELIRNGELLNWNTYIPPIEHTTDNAAMIAITAYFKYLKNDFSDIRAIPYTRSK